MGRKIVYLNRLASLRRWRKKWIVAWNINKEAGFCLECQIVVFYMFYPLILIEAWRKEVDLQIDFADFKSIFFFIAFHLDWSRTIAILCETLYHSNYNYWKKSYLQLDFNFKYKLYLLVKFGWNRCGCCRSLISIVMAGVARFFFQFAFKASFKNFSHHFSHKGVDIFAVFERRILQQLWLILVFFFGLSFLLPILKTSWLMLC